MKRAKSGQKSGKVQTRILLLGNPNCGKSTLFNALTGGHAKTGNWHGVTVGVSEREAVLAEGKRAVIADLPGIYSLSEPNMEERFAKAEVDKGGYDAALVVADALTLSRSLRLFFDAARTAPRVLLAVTMCDLLKRRGGFLDEKALSRKIGAPVICINAHSRADIRRLKGFLVRELHRLSNREGDCAPSGMEIPASTAGSGGRSAFASGSNVRTAFQTTSGGRAAFQTNSISEHLLTSAGRNGLTEHSCDGREREISLAGIWSGGAYRENRADKFLYNPFFAVPLFFLTMLAVFFVAFANKMPGVVLKDLLERAISEGIGKNLAAKIAEAGAADAASGFVSALFSGLGMLLSFLPQIAILYFALFLMEESGYMSALAFMTDGIFRKVGLTGRAAFSVLMGFGCSAAAILTTRGLENKRLQKRAILILPYVSCSAKMPVYLAVVSAFFEHKFLALAAIYFTGLLFVFAAAFLLKAIFPADGDFVMEIAHLQIPSLRLVLKSLLFYLKQFIMKIATVVAAVLVVMWFMLSFTFSFRYVGEGGSGCMAEILCRGLRYLFYPMGIRDWRIALSAVTGLIAKESVAGMLSVFYGEELSCAMSAVSALAFTVFIMTCAPCVSAIAAAAKELGWKTALGYAAAQTGIAFLLSYAVYGMLMHGIASSAVIAAALIAVTAGSAIKYKRAGRKREKIYGRRADKAQRFHR